MCRPSRVMHHSCQRQGSCRSRPVPETAPLCSQQQLRDLHRVEGGTLLDLVAAHKEVKAASVRAADVAAHAADVDIIARGGVQRCGEAVGGAACTQRGVLRQGTWRGVGARASDSRWPQSVIAGASGVMRCVLRSACAARAPTKDRPEPQQACPRTRLHYPRLPASLARLPMGRTPLRPTLPTPSPLLPPHTGR